MSLKTITGNITQTDPESGLESVLSSIFGTEIEFNSANHWTGYVSLSGFGFSDVWVSWLIHSYGLSSARIETTVTSTKPSIDTSNTTQSIQNDNHTVSINNNANLFSSKSSLNLVARLFMSKDKNSLVFILTDKDGDGSPLIFFYVMRDNNGDAFYSVGNGPNTSGATGVWNRQASSATDSVAYVSNIQLGNSFVAEYIKGYMSTDQIYLTKMPNLCSLNGGLAISAMISVYQPQSMFSQNGSVPTYYLDGERYIKVGMGNIYSGDPLLVPFIPY